MNPFMWIRVLNRLSRIEAKLEVLMASVDEMKVELGRINAATTDLGDSVSNVASDITELIALVSSNPDAAGLQEVQDGLKGAADTLETVAASLKATASQWPAGPPTPTP